MPKTPVFQPSESIVRTSLAVGEMFSHYLIQKELGRGGMGVVYRALDVNLQRVVALKLILPSHKITPKEITLFMQEAKITAQLQHENIVQIYEVGEAPQNYFAMEFVEGKTLKSLIQKNKIGIQRIPKILKQCALALHKVHKKGIVHRDIKPENIMITKKGKPKIMDFGLAKELDAKSLFSHHENIIGTPAYMSPEQANGKKIDRRSDVYSLGATLYEALTHQLPFQGTNILNLLFQIMNKDPLLPRQLDESIPIDLEAIAMKCLEKNPDKRYRTAKDLALDLENFRKNRPVSAKPITKWRKLQKWVARNRAISLAGVLVFVSLLLGTTISTLLWQKAEQEKEKAQEEVGYALVERAKRYGCV